MSNMLVPPAGDRFSNYLSDVMLGTWKFRPDGQDRPGITYPELVEVAHTLQSQNPGKGTFIHLLIFEAASDEFGLSMQYKFGEEELNKVRDTTYKGRLLDTYIDFFQKQTGLAYKGYEGFRSHVVAIRYTKPN